MWGETKRMFFNKNFLAAWLIACISIAIGQTYPSLKKALTCGTFISILEGSLKSQAVSFAIPVAAVLPWSDSILQEYKSGFLKETPPRIPSITNKNNSRNSQTPILSGPQFSSASIHSTG